MQPLTLLPYALRGPGDIPGILARILRLEMRGVLCPGANPGRTRGEIPARKEPLLLSPWNLLTGYDWCVSKLITCCVSQVKPWGGLAGINNLKDVSVWSI